MQASHAPAARTIISFADGTMSALRWGDEAKAPDLIFLHATGFNGQTYAPLLAPLADEFSIIAPDQRGHGLSQLPADPSGLVDWWPYAHDIVELMDRCAENDARPVALAGHSMGGIVSILAAAKRPERVRAIVLLDPVLMPRTFRLSLYSPFGRALARRSRLAKGAAGRRAEFTSRQEATDIYRTRKAFSGWGPGFLESYVEGGFVQNESDGVRLACAPQWESATFAAHRHNSWRALKSLGMPIRLLAAERGSTVIGGIAKVQRLAPHVIAETVPGAGHLFPMERPEIARAALEWALRTTS